MPWPLAKVPGCSACLLVGGGNDDVVGVVRCGAVWSRVTGLVSLGSRDLVVGVPGISGDLGSWRAIGKLQRMQIYDLQLLQVSAQQGVAGRKISTKPPRSRRHGIDNAQPTATVSLRLDATAIRGSRRRAQQARRSGGGCGLRWWIDGGPASTRATAAGCQTGVSASLITESLAAGRG